MKVLRRIQRLWETARPRRSVDTVAVLGFHSSDEEAETLRETFDSFEHPRKKLHLHSAEREGELHSLSSEIGPLPIACIHPHYSYPASYLGDLAKDCDPRANAVWTADPDARPGRLGDRSNPDVYRSLIPAHVFRLLYSSIDRHISEPKRGTRSRAVELRRCETGPVEVNGAVPNTLHQLNGLYWLVDYAHRMDRRCIEAYLQYKGFGTDALDRPSDEFLESLTPIQYRHLLFFLNTNVVGKRAIKYLEEHIDLSTVERAIDVGSGYGGLVKALSARGCEATGLEIMRSLMELAEINLAGHDAKLIVGDFMKRELEPEHYDLVTMTDVIEHVADVELAIRRTGEILRAGGYAYIKVPNYRFIDYVREDSHTGLFAITLLRHDPACAYLRAVRDMPYSVGEYYDHDYYVKKCAAHGLELVRSAPVETPIDEGRALLDKCRATFEQWKRESEIEAAMKDDIIGKVDAFLAEFEATLDDKPDELFARDFMSSHWNMFFRKRAD